MTGAAGYLWMLGTYPCSIGTCPVLMRSIDGGRSFVRVGTPPVGMYDIEFANRQDGYAYDAEASAGATTLYWTGDGGKVWHSALARFRASRPLPVVITRGNAYAFVPKGCSGDGQCRALDLASSAVTGDVWTTRPLPLTLDEVNSEVGLAAFGSKVWLIVAGASANAVLLVSDDGGRSFESLPSRGMGGGLACYATATSAMTLWGFCATGSLGYAVRSTNGGRDFARLSGWKYEASNAGSILPLSNKEAVFQPRQGFFWLTRDGGEHFSSVRFSSLWTSPNYGFSIAFASTTTWLVLGIQEPGEHNLMWRTTNGGRPWQSVKAPTVTATTVNRADLSRFVALAQKGLRVPFEAAYRFVPPLATGAGQLRDFRVWSEPPVGSDSEGNFVYEAPFGRGTFRFIQNGGDDYECLRAVPQSAWRCVGPYHPIFNEEVMQVEGYRYPMWVAGEMTLGLSPPLALSRRVVLGRRLWCLHIHDVSLVCITKMGQLAFDAISGTSGGNFRQVELVSLALISSKSAFVLPARPTPWNRESFDLCGKSQCPTPGISF